MPMLLLPAHLAVSAMPDYARDTVPGSPAMRTYLCLTYNSASMALRAQWPIPDSRLRGLAGCPIDSLIERRRECAANSKAQSRTPVSQAMPDLTLSSLRQTLKSAWFIDPS